MDAAKLETRLSLLQEDLVVASQSDLLQCKCKYGYMIYKYRTYTELYLSIITVHIVEIYHIESIIFDQPMHDLI